MIWCFVELGWSLGYPIESSRHLYLSNGLPTVEQSSNIPDQFHSRWK
jgi:hypothetical protein